MLRLVFLVVLSLSLSFASSIKINQGWSLVGTNLTISDANATFSSCTSVWKYDNTLGWKVISPNGSLNAALDKVTFPSFSSINSGEGFWTNCPSSFTKNINGTLDTNTTISLPKSGWYLKSLKSNNPITDISSVFYDSSIYTIWTYNSEGWSAYSSDPAISLELSKAEISSLTNIAVNEGFWINVHKSTNIQETDSSHTVQALIGTKPATTTQCPYGGSAIYTGLDKNNNNTLDVDERDANPQLVCNGKPGASGNSGYTSLVDTQPATTTQCSYGGSAIYTGLDTNNNNILEPNERDANPQLVCNGKPGANGTNGTNGTAGESGLNSLVKTEDANTTQCQYGGTVIYTGLDDNKDGTLQVTERDTSKLVCNGSPGANGNSGYTSLVDTQPATTTQCPYGGSAIYTGLDKNNNNTLDVDERDANPQLVCNGKPGANGTNGANGQDGADGTSVSALVNPIVYVPTSTLSGSINLANILARRLFKSLTSDGTQGLWISSNSIISSLTPPDIGENKSLTPAPFVTRKVDVVDGSYTISGIPSGSYSLVYVDGDGKGAKIDDITILPDTNNTKNIDSNDASDVGSVTLKLASLTGIAISDATIRVNEVDLNTTTDSSGNASFENLPAGSYSITIKANGYVSKYMSFNITSDTQTDLQTIELNSQRGYLSGKVEIPGAVNNSNAFIYLMASDGSVLTTMSDILGNYTIPSVPVGENYSIVATAHDTISAKADGLSISYGSTTMAPLLTLVENQSQTGVIQGYARYNDINTSLAHEGIIVSIEGTDLEAITARDGSYIINNVPIQDGDYTLNFTESRYITQTKTGVKVVEAASTFIKDVKLIRAVGSVSGSVSVNGSSSADKSATITITTPTATITTTSDATSGDFSLTGVPVGVHTLVASKEGFGAYSSAVEVDASTATNIGSFALTQYTLSGSTNIEGATVRIIGTNISTTTSSDGNFTLYGLLPKTYQLQVSKAGYITSDMYLVTVENLKTTFEDTITLIQAKGTLGGIAQLYGESDHSGISVSIASIGSVSTNSLGVWKISIPTGTYSNNNITFSKSGYQTQSYTDGFTIEASTQTDISKYTLNPNIGTIKGKIVDDTNTPLQGVSVAIVGSINSYSADTNSSGEFELHVAVGSYLVTAMKSGYGYGQQSDINITYNATNNTLVSTPMQLNTNKITGVISVEGNDDNKAGVTITLTNLSDSTTSDGVIVGTSGDFTINAVKPGNYKLEIIHSNSDYKPVTMELYNVSDDGYIFSTPIKLEKTALAKDYDMLTFDYIKGQNENNASNVRYNLNLPTSMPNGSSVVWSSDDQTLVSNSGLVTLPTSSATNTLNLTATLSYTGESDKQVPFALTIVKDYQPIFDTNTSTITVDEDFGYLFKTIKATNANKEAITYSITNEINTTILDTLSIDANTGEIALKSKADANGDASFDIVATTHNKSATKHINFTVNPVADVVSAKLDNNQTISPNTTITLNPNLSTDIDGDATYSWKVIKPDNSTQTITSDTYTPTTTGIYTLELNVSNSVGSSVATQNFTVLPTISISDVNVTEGSDAVFTVTVSAHDNNVTLDYATLSGTALEIKDYKKVSGNLVFLSGETSKTITVPIVTDLIPEPTENFQIVLSNIDGAVDTHSNTIDTLEATANIAYEPLDLFYHTSDTALYISDLAGCYESYNYCAISEIGDFDGDGYSDIVIGSSEYSDATGQISLIKGGSSIGTVGVLSSDDASVVKIDGPSTYDFFGSKISSAGDIDHDGKSDILVGMAEYSNPSLYVIKSTSSAIANSDIATLENNTTYNHISKIVGGYTPTNIGDFNGDGYDDFAFANYKDSSYTGVVYILYGNYLDTESNMNDYVVAHKAVEIRGDSTYNYLGYSISKAGDFNGDGYDDVAIGAYRATDNKGTVYIAFGGSNVDSNMSASTLVQSNGMEIIGSRTYSDFGKSVSGGSDINGDGISDLLIGQEIYFSGGTRYDGGAYAIFGSRNYHKNDTLEISSLDSHNGVAFRGESVSHAGYSVSILGDVNGDGYDDMAIGAYHSGSNKGTVYVVYGGDHLQGIYNNPTLLSELNGSNGFSIIGENEGDQIGKIVSNGGDFNSDGFADILTMSNDGRKAYVIYGGDYSNSVTHIAYGSSGETKVGTTGADTIVAGDEYPKDIDGNGGKDVLLGSRDIERYSVPDLNFLRINGGLAYSGAAVTSNILTFNVSGEDINLSSFGKKLQNINTLDISGDGPNTLYLDYKAVKDTVSYNPLLGFSTLIVKGDSDDKVIFDKTQWLENSGTYTRGDIKFTTAGIVGTPSIYIYGTETSEDAGSTKIKVMRDNANYESKVDYTISNGTALNGVDYNVSSLSGTLVFYEGELIKEISVDFIKDDKLESDKNLTITLSNPVGATIDLSAYSATLVITDNSIGVDTLSGKDGFTIDFAGTNDNKYYGDAVTSVGDYNKDGYEDFIVGGSNDYRLVYGGEYLKNSSEFNVSDTSRYEILNKLYSSVSVEPIGDFNGDGYDDFLGYNDNSSNVVIYLGGSSFDESRTILIDVDANFGLGAIGDINGDGYDDIAIAHNSSDINGTLDVVFGSGSYTQNSNLSIDNYNYFSMTEENKDDNFGKSISNGGDINGDGYSDFIIGAYGNGDAGSSAGKAYVIFGSENIGDSGSIDISNLGADGFSFTGLESYDYLGNSVSMLGDVNGDGYTDMGIGSYNDEEGYLYVVYGNSNLSDVNITDLKNGGGSAGFAIHGDISHAYFANSIQYIGDMNSDGYDDILTSSLKNLENGKNTVYVIFGNAIDTGSVFNIADLNVSQGFGLRAEIEGDQFGEYDYYYTKKMACAGDIDGDGFNDIIIGAPRLSVNSSYGGKAYVLFGRDFSGRATYTGTNESNIPTNISHNGVYDYYYPLQGDDNMSLDDGPNMVSLAQGDDEVVYNEFQNDSKIGKILGGKGFDTLKFSDGGGDTSNLNFGNFMDNRIKGIEKIDLYANGDDGSAAEHHLTMSKLDILNILDSDQQTFYVDGDQYDSVTITDGTWAENDNDNDADYRTWNLEASPIKLKINNNITTITISGVSQ